MACFLFVDRKEMLCLVLAEEGKLALVLQPLVSRPFVDCSSQRRSQKRCQKAQAKEEREEEERERVQQEKNLVLVMRVIQSK